MSLVYPLDDQLLLSPVPHLLESCRALTLEESNSIDGFIYALDRQIADLDAQLRHINRVRDALSLNRAVHRNRLLPVNRIPDELLIEIFYLYLPKLPVVNMWLPLVLSHVCRRWRSVVTSDARIWNVIDVSKLRGPLIDLWVARSGDSPLMVVESSSRPPHPSILQQSHRLRVLHAYSETLKELSESGNEFPMLRVLHCQAIHKELPHFSKLPFAQITHLAAGTSSLPWVIAQMPNLLSLDVIHKLGVSVRSEPLVHPRLQYLKLHNPSDTRRSTTFQKFDFPSLKFLAIIKASGFSPTPTAAIQHIIASSTCLDTLILHNTYPEGAVEFTRLLERLPDLRKLCIRDDWDLHIETSLVVDTIRDLALALSSRPSFLPKLKFLTLGGVISHERVAVPLSTARSERSLVDGDWPFSWLEDSGCPGDGALEALTL